MARGERNAAMSDFGTSLMYSKTAAELNHSEKYFLMIGGINPRPIAFVSTVSKNGICNLAPYSFFNAMSAEPPIVVFGPSCTDDPERPYKDTYVNLVDTQECVIQMVTYDMGEAMVKCSANLAPEVDEFQISGFTPIASDIVKAPRVKESPFQMECKLLEMKNFGKFPGGGNMAICEVVKFHIDEKIFKPGTTRIDPLITDFIGRNGGHFYTRASADAMFEMKLP